MTQIQRRRLNYGDEGKEVAPRKRRRKPQRHMPHGALEHHNREGDKARRHVQAIVDNADLQTLLKAHGVQASQLANQITKTEAELVAFLASGKADPAKTLDMVQQLEGVRRSTVEDLRKTTRLLEELRYPQVSLAAVTAPDQQAFFASGSSRLFADEDAQGEGI
jgi:hypothetical protein